MTLALDIPESAAPAGRPDWAVRIAAAWNKTREGVIEVGRLLAAAKAALAHGEFEAMIRADLPFTPSTAQRLMKIARDVRLTDPLLREKLPASWGTLYELTKLDDQTLRHAIATGQVKQDTELRDVLKIRTPRRARSATTLSEWMRKSVTPLLTSSSGVPYADLDRAKIRAEITRLDWLRMLLSDLELRVSDTGTVREHVSPQEFDALVARHRK